MITKVIMPQMSLTMQFGIVTKWLKSEGETVTGGEPICTVEGDKAIVEIESPATGILKKIVAIEGKEFPVKQPMAYIGDSDDVVEVEPISDTEVEDVSKSESEERIQKTENASVDKRVKASPVAKRLAKEMKIDLQKIKGTGPSGSITKEDILAFGVATPIGQEPGVDEGISRELSSIEKIIADRMAQSNREIPHFHLSISCNFTQANKLRNDFNKDNNIEQHISLTDILIWSVSRELTNHKILCSSINENQVITHSKINIGLAVDTPKGLLVIVIKEADQISLTEIALARKELTQRAMLGEQTVEDLSGATFTITNLGMFGIESFDPIITPGQVGVLSIGILKDSIELDNDGNVKSFKQLSITLGCDHRVVDGAAGAKFLSSVKLNLENPREMFQQ